ALEGHPALERLGETIARRELDQRGVVLPERIVGLEPHASRFTGACALERLLDAGKHRPVAAVQVRPFAFAGLDRVALRVVQPVAHPHPAVARDHGFHLPLPKTWTALPAV